MFRINVFTIVFKEVIKPLEDMTSFVDYPLCLLFKNVSLRLNVKVDATTSKKKECKMRRIKRRNQVIKCLSEKSWDKASVSHYSSQPFYTHTHTHSHTYLHTHTFTHTHNFSRFILWRWGFTTCVCSTYVGVGVCVCVCVCVCK